MNLDGDVCKLNQEQIIYNISAKPGFNVQAKEDLFIILDTELNEELIDEGFAREFVSRIQQMRKQNDYEMMDNIRIAYTATEKLESAISKFAAYISDETLAVELANKHVEHMTKDKLNGEEIEFFIEKVN